MRKLNDVIEGFTQDSCGGFVAKLLKGEADYRADCCPASLPNLLIIFI